MNSERRFPNASCQASNEQEDGWPGLERFAKPRRYTKSDSFLN